MFTIVFTGREVAVYCAAHLGDITKATKAYSTGDIGLALKDAFMKCDNIIVAEEAVKEMKKIVEDDMSKIHRYKLCSCVIVHVHLYTCIMCVNVVFAYVDSVQMSVNFFAWVCMLCVH